MAAQVKVRVCGLSLLGLRLNAGHVFDDSTAKGGSRNCAAVVNLTFYLLNELLATLERQCDNYNPK